MTLTLPPVGQRIGRVTGPGEFPRDDAGIVLAHVSDRWGSYAIVLMDDGTTQRCHSLNTGPGIGWHAL
jgi:hypothetical protein